MTITIAHLKTQKKAYRNGSERDEINQRMPNIKNVWEL
jgi:hypothetical protein